MSKTPLPARNFPFGDRPIRLAMLGMIAGNGHPYSWSAIINSYDKAEMAKNPYAGITRYLGAQPFESVRIPNTQVTHIWTDDPKDAALAAQLSAALPAARLRPSPGPGLWDFLAAIAANRLLVTPDTSAVHAACALGVRVVGLYPEPAWNLASWGPWGPGHQALRSPQGGLQGLPLEPVRAAALRALKNRRPLP